MLGKYADQCNEKILRIEFWSDSFQFSLIICIYASGFYGFFFVYYCNDLTKCSIDLSMSLGKNVLYIFTDPSIIVWEKLCLPKFAF